MLTGQMLRDKCAPRNPHPRIRKRISDIKTLDRISETAPEPKIESRRVTLECQTLKVREPVSRSFVTDLP